VLDLAKDPRHGLDWPWRREALARGDECLALFDGPKLAGFSWYTAHPSPVLGDRTLRFDPRWIYTYHGLTLPPYRGRRLYGLGRALALRRFCDLGHQGLVTCIERLNFASLRSSYALGFRRCGSLYRLGRGRRFAAWADGSCGAHGIALGPRWEAGEP
jgi:hypothetical protein